MITRAFGGIDTFNGHSVLTLGFTLLWLIKWQVRYIRVMDEYNRPWWYLLPDFHAAHDVLYHDLEVMWRVYGK